MTDPDQCDVKGCRFHAAGIWPTVDENHPVKLCIPHSPPGLRITERVPGQRRPSQDLVEP